MNVRPAGTSSRAGDDHAIGFGFVEQRRLAGRSENHEAGQRRGQPARERGAQPDEVDLVATVERRGNRVEHAGEFIAVNCRRRCDAAS